MHYNKHIRTNNESLNERFSFYDGSAPAKEARLQLSLAPVTEAQLRLSLAPAKEARLRLPNTGLLPNCPKYKKL